MDSCVGACVWCVCEYVSMCWYACVYVCACVGMGVRGCMWARVVRL